MSIRGIIAAIVVITASHPSQILVGRVINHIYIGMELSVVPIYQAELTPRRARGFIVTTYQTSLYMAGLVMQGICRGTSTLDSSAAYRVPFGLFFVVPTFVACTILFMPEWPRWFLLQDRREDALNALRQVREGKSTEEEIEAEMAMIAHTVRTEVQQLPLINIFRGTNPTRTAIVCGVNFFMQASGQIFAQVYGALFVKSLGTRQSVGRRTLTLTGASIRMAAPLTMGGRGSVANPSAGVMACIVAKMPIFMHGYSLGWAPNAHLLSSKIPSLGVRDMTYRVASCLSIATQFACSFSLPYLLNAPYANLGARVGFIFGAFAAVSILFAYFMVPNCAGRSLEQIDILFKSGVSKRKFHSADIQELSRDVDVAEKKGLDIKTSYREVSDAER